MATRKQIVHVIREAARTDPNALPMVHIETVKGGEITFGVRVVARTGEKARAEAQNQFRQLHKFVKSIKDAELAAELKASLKRQEATA